MLGYGVSNLSERVLTAFPITWYPNSGLSTASDTSDRFSSHPVVARVRQYRKRCREAISACGNFALEVQPFFAFAATETLQHVQRALRGGNLNSDERPPHDPDHVVEHALGTFLLKDRIATFTDERKLMTVTRTNK